jgi:RNA polymerase sigma-70 factor, ECF subfamily
MLRAKRLNWQSMNPNATLPPPVDPLPADTDERDLARRLARGEPNALEALIERYAQRVTRLARRLLGWGDGADDVAQDVFLTVMHKAPMFRGEARLWTYLTAITVNRTRSLRRRRWLGERVLQAIASTRATPRDHLPARERDATAEAVRGAVAGLPNGYREVIVLRYLEELSIGEVAEVLGLRPNTVEVRLSRARKLLEPELAKLIRGE